MIGEALIEALGDLQPAWHKDANCREYPHLEFVDVSGTIGPQLQVCGRCLVRVDCLAVALADASLMGIWGGTSTSARRAMRVAAKARPL